MQMEVATTEMKQRLTLAEFADYCRGVHPQEVLFYTKDQTWYNMADPMVMSITFHGVFVFPTRNTIRLESDSCVATIEGVRSILLQAAGKGSDSVVQCCCRLGDREVTYMFLLRKL